MGSLLATMLVQSSDDASGAAFAVFGLGFFLMMMAFAILMIAAVWTVFSKAGQPGWAVLIPIYNAIVMLKVAKKPLWWILLFLVPFVNIVIAILVAIAIANNFGKSTGFGVGLAFLGFIFYPILAWGDAQYQA